jgi:transcription initiation factor TFIIIB Brf1 subunit/transcription initiation factor TFIIB
LSTTGTAEYHKPKQCKICHSPTSVIYDYQTQESVCNMCGAVAPIDDDVTQANIKDSINGVNYLGSPRTNHEDKSTQEYYTRSNMVYELSTTVYVPGVNNQDEVKGKNQFYEAKRLQKMNTKVLQYYSKNKRGGMISLLDADRLLYKLKIDLNLSPAIIQRSLYYFKLIQDKNLLKGRSTINMVIICIHLSLLELNNIYRPFEALTSTLDNFTPKKIFSLMRMYRCICAGLEINPRTFHPYEPLDNNKSKQPKFLNKYITQMKLDYPKLYPRAAEILKIMHEHPLGISGHRPSIVELCCLIKAYEEDWERNNPQIVKNQYYANGENIHKKKKGYRGSQKDRLPRRAFFIVGNTNPVSVRKTIMFIEDRLEKNNEQSKK